jgi:hypothetical protein
MKNLKKNWLVIFAIIVNLITLLLMIDLGSFDSMENHLTNGGLVVSRPIEYSALASFSILVSSFLIIKNFYSVKE